MKAPANGLILHDCAAPGCALMAEPGHLMCGRHWSRLPPALRVEVADAWRALRRCATSTDALDAAARYRLARREAIEHFADGA